ncbi:MAG: alanine--glyoxylate aminotransferase family protein [Anaerolineae bacterium]|nr:alanine--glyoxylate aminotransferase family protein [Anaerolineae bacterium]
MTKDNKEETMTFKLFIPGPCAVHEDVLEAMAHPVYRHYGAEWLEIFNETIGLLKQVFQTQNDVFIIPGTGSAALDMAFGSMFAGGETVVIGDNGFFGARLREIAEAYGLRTVLFTAPHGQPLDPDDLRAVLAQEPDARAVAVVYHETGTTVLNPVEELAQAAHAAGLPIIVDAISALGGVSLPVDAWGIDVCVSVANKCLECPPGLGFISVGPRAWECVDRNATQTHGWYLNLRVWRDFAEKWASWHPYPVTLPTNNILGLRVSLRRIMSRGLQTHVERFARASRAVRRSFAAMGFEMLVEGVAASPIATAIKARPEFTVDALSQYLSDEHAILISGGLGQLHGKVFRIGHMGLAAEAPYLEALFLAVAAFMREQGFDVSDETALSGLAEVI